MQKKVVFRSLALAALLMVALSASAAFGAEPKVLLIAQDVMYDAWRPAWASNGSWMFIWDTLIGNDSNFNPKYPNLAEKWDILDGGKRFVFHLRDDVKWHDGAKFNAKDVKMSIERQVNPSLVPLPEYVTPFTTLVGYEDFVEGKASGISGIRVIDANTIEFRLTRPNALFLKGIAITSVLPEHILGKVPIKEFWSHSYWTHPIGTGAFKVSEFKPGQYMVLDAYKDYYRGVPKIDKINIRKVDVQLAALRGEADYGWVLSYEQAKELGKVKSINVFPVDQQYVRLFRVNLTAGPTADINFRKALMYGLDRNTIIESFFEGTAKPVAGYMGAGYWHNDNLKELQYDVNKAKQYLAKSNYDGRKIEILYYYLDQQTRDLLTAVQYYWNHLGIKVELRQVDGATATELVQHKRTYDLCYAARGYFDASQPLADLTSDSAINFAGYNNPKYNALIAKGLETLDAESRRKIYWEAQELLYNDVVVLPLYTPCIYIYQGNRLQIPVRSTGPWYPYDLQFHNWDIAQ